MRCLLPFVLLLLIPAEVQSHAAPKARVPGHGAGIQITPASVTLKGNYAEAHVLVTKTSQNAPTDVSSQVVLTSTNAEVVTVDPSGAIRPVHNGKTFIIATCEGATARVPVTVTAVTPGAPPDFLNEVLPVLTHAGCNMGACHGAASGKGGFRLSLLAYDPALDFESITRAAGARRIARSQPENSLLLRKPTLETPHRGGKRLEVGSADYKLLTDWIAAGCPGPAAKSPHVTALEITPPVRSLAIGGTQRFLVKAKYSDGSTRDATGEAIFTSSDETAASVSPSGEAKANGPGEGAVVVRYQGLVVTARVISPFAPPIVARSKASAPGRLEASLIDSMINQKLSALGLIPSGKCTDSDFLRRTSLDITGQLPSPDEAKAFLSDRSPDRRTRWIDSLLNRPEYVDFWTLKWADLLRCSREALTDKGMFALNGWIRRAVETNMPWDQFSRQVIVASGDTAKVGPANFFVAASTPEQRAEDASQVFLGVRIACAKCHNHPYDRWTQNQYYQMAAFFARVSSKAGAAKGQAVIFASDSGEMRNPKTQQNVAACALVGSSPLPTDYSTDRRSALADWVTSPQNPFFSHEIVNRIWKHFMGRGFIEAVDDMKATNPPSNGPLFDALSSDFAAHGFDVKRLMREIVCSDSYQRSGEVTANNKGDKAFYSHFLVRRLSAEQMLDALSVVTGVPEKFAGYPAGTHSQALADTQTPSYFLDLFGRPARTTTCSCERLDDPNLGQALHLMNSADVNNRLASKSGTVTSLISSKLTDAQIVQSLYLTCFSRYPTAPELKTDLKPLAVQADKKRAAVEDLAWALINSNEFRFNH